MGGGARLAAPPRWAEEGGDGGLGGVVSPSSWSWGAIGEWGGARRDGGNLTAGGAYRGWGGL